MCADPSQGKVKTRMDHPIPEPGRVGSEKDLEKLEAPRTASESAAHARGARLIDLQCEISFCCTRISLLARRDCTSRVPACPAGLQLRRNSASAPLFRPRAMASPTCSGRGRAGIWSELARG